MIRAERVEKLIRDKKTAYETGGFEGGALWHWVDTTQGVAVGSQSSEVDTAEDCRDALQDTVVEDVALGVKIGRAMKDGDLCFYASVDDADGRHLHFFFTGPSEDAVVESLIQAFAREAS